MRLIDLPVLYLNLDSREDRRYSTEQDLATLGFTEVSRVRASSWQELQASGFETPEGVTGPESACHIGHRLMWGKVVQSGRPHLLLEDDVWWSSRAHQFLRELEPNWSEYRILFLGASHLWLPDFDPGWCNGPSVIREGYGYGLFAYVVTPEAAKALIRESVRRGLIVADFLTRNYLTGPEPGRMKSMVVHPHVAAVKVHLGSDIARRMPFEEVFANHFTP